MLIIESLSVPSFKYKIWKDTKVNVLSMIVFVKLFHLFGNKENNISFFGYIVRKFLVFVMSHQLSHIFALKEEMVILTESHK